MPFRSLLLLLFAWGDGAATDQCALRNCDCLLWRSAFRLADFGGMLCTRLKASCSLENAGS